MYRHFSKPKTAMLTVIDSSAYPRTVANVWLLELETPSAKTYWYQRFGDTTWLEEEKQPIELLCDTESQWRS